MFGVKTSEKKPDEEERAWKRLRWIILPLLPLIFISNKWYRYCTDVLFTFWQMYPTVLLELLCGCDIEATGDAILSEETSILVMNHRTRTDWNFLWPAIYHTTVGTNRFRYPTKFILKDIIRHIPGPGWVMQLACFLYIKRCWTADKPKLRSLVDYFCSMSYKFSLLLFPEGTDLTVTTRRISNRFAEKNDLKKYDYVLHPRTTGFSFLAGRLLSKNALDSLYDITLAYCDVIPQTEKDILRGNFPKKIKMHFRRYPSTVLPHSEDNLKKFLEKCWLEKEQILRNFHANGDFPIGRALLKSNRVELYLALFFWTMLPVLVFYMFVINVYFRIIVVFHTSFLTVINVAFDGFQDFEIAVYNIKRNLFGSNLDSKEKISI